MRWTQKADGEPGPEVTVVSDRLGVPWQRSYVLWRADEDGLRWGRTWVELLTRGPLTDTTGDAR